MIKILESLTPNDLLSVAQVSIQFNRLALYTFKRKYKKFEIYRYFRSLDENKLSRIFENFGHLMRELDLIPLFYPWHSMKLQIKSIQLIKKHCTKTENMKILKLSDFSNIGRQLDILLPMFEGLETLELKKVTLSMN